MIKYTIDKTFDTNEPVCIRYQHTSSVMPFHTHEFIEIVYITSGEGVQTINGVDYKVKPGSCIIVSPDDVHGFSGDMTYYNLFFMPGFLSSQLTNPAFPVFALSIFSELQAEVSEKNAFVNFSDSQQKKIDSILSTLFEEYTGSLVGRETSVQCYAMLFLNEIYRYLTTGDADIAGEVEVSEILRYIDTHYNEKLTLSELAQRCYYNPKYFSRIFKKYYGVTVSAYIQSKRLEHGKQLLENSTLSLDEIACDSGYSDSTAFYKSFKKAYGLSPGEYRKMGCKKSPDRKK